MSSPKSCLMISRIKCPYEKFVLILLCLVLAPRVHLSINVPFMQTPTGVGHIYYRVRFNFRMVLYSRYSRIGSHPRKFRPAKI